MKSKSRPKGGRITGYRFLPVSQDLWPHATIKTQNQIIQIKSSPNRMLQLSVIKLVNLNKPPSCPESSRIVQILLAPQKLLHSISKTNDTIFYIQVQFNITSLNG